MSMPAAKRQRLSGPKKELIKRDLLTLPQEIVFLVFSFLDAADLTTCARVSTKWYAAASDEQVSEAQSSHWEVHECSRLCIAVEAVVPIPVPQS
jgi:F-box-like